MRATRVRCACHDLPLQLWGPTRRDRVARTMICQCTVLTQAMHAYIHVIHPVSCRVVMHAFMRSFTCVHACMCAVMNASMHECVHARLQANINKNMHAMHTDRQIDIHIPIHACKRTYIQPPTHTYMRACAYACVR